jgi:lysophospholipase L1-like esterase
MFSTFQSRNESLRDVCAAAIDTRRVRATIFALAITLPCAMAAEPRPNENWIATWTTANSDSTNPVIQQIIKTNRDVTEFDSQTIREIVRTTVGGSAIRIRLTNTFGQTPVTFGAASVAIQKDGAALLPGSNHAVTFGGKQAITIPEGADALSDEIPLTTAPQQNLSVSLFAAKPTGPATRHPSAFQTNYVSETGNFTAEEMADHFKKEVGAWFFIAEVEVLAAKEVPGTIVAFGDSITDGASTKPDTYQRWSDVLARRFTADNSGKRSFAVVNAGFGGNRVLSSSPCFAENALARLDRDVFAVAGVRGVILFEGTNDIGQPDTHAPALWAPCLAQAHITADELVAGYAQIIAQVHAHHLKIIGATILPFKGFNGFTEKGEATRVAANAWIRDSHAFDGVIDFDAALADPANRAQMAAQYDSGDHLHPNPAGHEAMARSVDLALFRK